MPTPTPKEQEFLDAVKAKFENKNDKNPDKKAKHEEMSDVEDRVYKALIKEAEKEGEMGWSTIRTVINAEVKGELAEAVDAHNKSEKAERLAKNTAKKTGLGNMLKNTVGNTVGKVADQVQDASFDAKKERIKTDVDVEELVTLAKDMGLPEKSAAVKKEAPGKAAPVASGSVESMIKSAAGADKKLSSAELDTLIADPAFIAAAQKLGGKMKVQQNDDDKKDAITIGSKAVTLSKVDPSLRFADDVTSHDVTLQAVGTQQSGGKGKSK
jgi:hypothetical protein